MRCLHVWSSRDRECDQRRHAALKIACAKTACKGVLSMIAGSVRARNCQRPTRPAWAMSTRFYELTIAQLQSISVEAGLKFIYFRYPYNTHALMVKKWQLDPTFCLFINASEKCWLPKMHKSMVDKLTEPHHNSISLLISFVSQSRTRKQVNFPYLISFVKRDASGTVCDS